MSNNLTVGLSSKDSVRDLRRHYLEDLLIGYCEFHDIAYVDISKDRTRFFSVYRFVFAFFCCDLLGYNCSDVGYVLKRDRTTVRHMINSFFELHSIGTDKLLEEVYKKSISYFNGCYKNARFDKGSSEQSIVDSAWGENITLGFVSPYVYCGLMESFRKRYVKRLNLRLN
jgi:hypothetical protein